jgi:hypothetical protein
VGSKAEIKKKKRESNIRWGKQSKRTQMHIYLKRHRKHSQARGGVTRNALPHYPLPSVLIFYVFSLPLRRSCEQNSILRVRSSAFTLKWQQKKGGCLLG